MTASGEEVRVVGSTRRDSYTTWTGSREQWDGWRPYYSFSHTLGDLGASHLAILLKANTTILGTKPTLADMETKAG